MGRRLTQNLTDEDRRNRRKTPEHRAWIKLIFERDNYTCQICKKVGGVLNAHHYFNWAEYIELRYDLDNGICLCEKCHAIYHKQYGYMNNTKNQFEEFKNAKT